MKSTVKEKEIIDHLELNMKLCKKSIDEAREKGQFDAEMYWKGKFTAYEDIYRMFPSKDDSLWLLMSK